MVTQILTTEKYFKNTRIFMPFDLAHNSYKYCFAYGNTTNSKGEIL